MSVDLYSRWRQDCLTKLRSAKSSHNLCSLGSLNQQTIGFNTLTSIMFVHGVQAAVFYPHAHYSPLNSDILPPSPPRILRIVSPRRPGRPKPFRMTYLPKFSLPSLPPSLLPLGRYRNRLSSLSKPTLIEHDRIHEYSKPARQCFGQTLRRLCI